MNIGRSPLYAARTQERRQMLYLNNRWREFNKIKLIDSSKHLNIRIRRVEFLAAMEDRCGNSFSDIPRNSLPQLLKIL